MLYSKNGSIPKPQTDGTDGWIEVPDPPVVQEGLEVVWWYPPGWVVRTPKPATTDDVADWSWSQSQQKWTAIARELPVIEMETDVIDLGSGSAAQTLSIDGATGAETITGSASPSP
jgi:hypothetical protein